MKTTIFSLLVAASAFTFTSCEKESLNPTSAKSNRQILTNETITSVNINSDGTCEAVTTPLIAGQHIDAGNITVTNDADYIYVTYTTANGYTLTETHLYVGNCEAIPVTGAGNPSPGRFPYKNGHDNTTSYTYKVPVSAIPVGTCGCIAAHAAVEKLDSYGNVVDAQTAWGSGSLINAKGSWAMKFEYCSCENTEPNTDANENGNEIVIPIGD